MEYIKTIESIKKREVNKVIVFGTGKFWRDSIVFLNEGIDDIVKHIDFFMDNDRSKWGTYLHGKEIISPEYLLTNKEETLVFVASSYYNEISTQLNKYGLIENYHYIKDFYLFSELVKHYAMKKKLIKYKGIHKGKRAFLIGSGPSLKIEDLNKLKNEITFGCNKIYLSFDQTDWRPTYYVSIDSVFIEDNFENIKLLDIKKFLPIEASTFFGNLSGEYNYLKHIGRENEFNFSTDIVEGVYGGWTVIYTMLQIAFYMGITESYLLGVDFKFNIPKPTGELSKYGEIILRGQGEENHFHKDYRKEGERWTIPQLDKQYKAFQCARDTYNDNNRKIYNATRITALDVFPLADFDNILG